MIPAINPAQAAMTTIVTARRSTWASGKRPIISSRRFTRMMSQRPVTSTNRTNRQMTNSEIAPNTTVTTPSTGVRNRLRRSQVQRVDVHRSTSARRRLAMLTNTDVTSEIKM